MYKNILVPIAPDHAAKTDGAIKVAQTLKSEGGAITLLTITEPVPGYIAQYLPEEQTEENRKEIEANLKADARGLEGVKTLVLPGHSGAAITEYAAENTIDLIIITSHRPGLQDYFLGSTAARVVRHAPCAVHVLR